MIKSAIELFSSVLPPPGSTPAGGTAFPSLAGSADAFFALAAAGDGIALAITPGIPDADRLVDDLRIITAKLPTRILEFPPPIPDDKTALGTRLKTVAALRAWKLNPYPAVVVAPFSAVIAPAPGAAEENAVIRLSTGKRTGKLDFSALVRGLADIGYRRLPMVEAEGDYSVRGGILDVWSPGDDYPVRAEFFGEELESLRRFDPSTQLSTGNTDTAEFLPVDSGTAEESAGTVLSILPEGGCVVAFEHNEYHLPFPETPRAQALYFTGEPPPPEARFRQLSTTTLPGFAELTGTEAHHPELFDARRRQLEEYLADAEKRDAVILRLDDLSGGFRYGNLVVVTKSDRVFTRRKTRVRGKATGEGARIHDFDDLEGGEYVVHLDYGVGKFIGSSEITVEGRRREVFTIEYDGGLLHVPAAHAHLLSRYVGVKGESVRLHRLDGKRWAKDRADAQKAVSDLAAQLLETQAKRQSAAGFAYDTHCDGLAEFEAAFPYEETADQEAAIAAVKRDLADSRPMDRLVCGDAGYGKTEVAMRAAYIAAMNGKQVAVLAPTTVLAEQHFETFVSRFDGTAVTIDSLSRLHGAGARSRTLGRIASGASDIVIGTHALLSSKIRWKDLSLIIIDEEQRFGVRHKEYLKRLRATADVLTLSATPIPRTLYKSMTGLSDLSLLKSPPRERVAVETHIVADTDETVRRAVEREIARGGQVYYLHNRVHSIGKAEKRLAALCPSARIAVAHGQMDASELACRMRAFERGEYDVLVSTTIVESGIDIPRANTILVERAGSFGLGELYQLRGRVGRSSRQGYAYFLLPPSMDVDAEARERLQALKRHGALGGGFNLALRDLELRGAGNLLGPEQSGHIAAVGFTLYCQLLTRTIAMMRGEKVRDTVDVKLNLDFAEARLDYRYIEEDSMRLSLMKRFAEAGSVGEVNRLAAEMSDRFGPPPESAKEFVHMIRLRLAAAAAGAGRIDVKDSRAVFYRPGGREIAFVTALKGKTVKARLAELIRAARGLARTARSRVSIPSENAEGPDI